MKDYVIIISMTNGQRWLHKCAKRNREAAIQNAMRWFSMYKQKEGLELSKITIKEDE